MGIFPLQDQVPDRNFPVHARHLPVSQVPVCVIFLILPPVDPEKVSHTAVIGNDPAAILFPLPLHKFLHISPGPPDTACHLFADKRVAVLLNDLPEIFFRPQDFHIFMLFHKRFHFRIFQPCVHVNGWDFRIKLPCHVEQHCGIFSAAERYIYAVHAVPLHPFTDPALCHPDFNFQRK